ncbi:hypothetical protein GH714_028094 [Hevea brasiliensis]|uniref:Peptidase S8/S53 domain-containing protein n=1 Tax=Hevea brasiliensis TaxID=3981 RepID=A0A6A6MLK6_HEVBR|nr:hypothetical protein GH714_028094 [Hevea brasiliensis]
MMAAIDDAIKDGIHVLSISIVSTEPLTYDNDGIAFGALHAVKNNIVVSCSAGNSGPAPSTLSNPAPWIITVGASSVDRAFWGPIVLGNGKKLCQCLPNSLSPEKVNGKIVLCIRGLGMRVGKGIEVKRAGGAGFVLGNGPKNGNDLTVDAHVLPATAVVADGAMQILNYIKSTDKPMAIIGEAKTVLHYSPAPSMATFTSRGPNVLDFNILKKRSFTLTVRARDAHTAKKYYKDSYAFGWYTWTDGYHSVRSPVAVSSHRFIMF